MLVAVVLTGIVPALSVVSVAARLIAMDSDLLYSDYFVVNEYFARMDSELDNKRRYLF